MNVSRQPSLGQACLRSPPSPISMREGACARSSVDSHTYTHTDRHPDKLPCTLPYMHTCMHADKQTVIHTYIYRQIHTYTYILAETYICLHMLTYIHTYIHAYILSYIYSHTHVSMCHLRVGPFVSAESMKQLACPQWHEAFYAGIPEELPDGRAVANAYFSDVTLIRWNTRRAISVLIRIGLYSSGNRVL